ncbi:MAG: hypothetical protein NT166_18455 [Candidatus Aminicenantes bacterium]|nr:hypothetical protein [Candidatus Aminicenantes bacterium]
MSVNFNLISATLDEDVHAGIITDVKAIEAKLPFAVTLPTEEKVSMRGIGLKSMDFMDKCYEYAVKNPELSPKHINMVEFEKDLKLAKQLQVLMQHLVPLVDKLKDTHMIVTYEAYNAARSFYQHMKNAANSNIPGTSAIAKELGKRFHVVRSTSTTNSNSSSSASSSESVKTAARERKTEEETEEIEK